MFGCVGHIHIPDARRTKVEDKSVSCVLFRISDESKGYKIFDQVAKRIIVSCSVIFEEDHIWDLNENSEREQLMELDWGDNIKEENKAQERKSLRSRHCFTN